MVQRRDSSVVDRDALSAMIQIDGLPHGSGVMRHEIPPAHQVVRGSAERKLPIDEAPAAGEHFYVLDDIAQAREIAESRADTQRVTILGGRETDHVTLENLFDRLEGTGEPATLNIILRADVRGSIEAIQKEFPLLRLPQIYGAIAFYLDHQAEVRSYLENEERRIQESTVPLSEANPELWSRLQRAREELSKPRQ